MNFMYNNQSMLKLKNVYMFLVSIMVLFWISFTYAEIHIGPQDHRYNDYGDDPQVDSHKLTGANTISEWIDVTSNKAKWILRLPNINDYDTNLWYALALIQITVNWILWMLAFVALIYTLYCWFLILSSWSDDKKASEWKKWIKNAAIAVAWIGLAWLIISAMIWFIETVVPNE